MFTGIDTAIWGLMICLMIMLEVPKAIYISLCKLTHIFDKSQTTYPKVCRACGRNSVSWGAFTNKREKDGKIIYTKHRCGFCRTVHKIVK